MTGKPRKRSKIRPRDAMRAKRAKAPEINPSPPGPQGGQYKPLQQALEKGALLNDAGRLCYPVSMVEDTISGACKRFNFFGRDSKYDFEVGGDSVYFGTGGAAVQTLDIDTHHYRAATLKDLYDFTRLADSLVNVSWFTRCCVATDVEDITDLDINTAYALIKGTNKPVGTSFTLGSTVDPIVDMFDIAMGGAGEFSKRPCCKAHISPIISPLRPGCLQQHLQKH